MKIDGKVVVVTGAAGGMGRALVRRFEAEGAAAVVGSDLGLDGVDVTREADIQRLFTIEKTRVTSRRLRV